MALFSCKKDSGGRYEGGAPSSVTWQEFDGLLAASGTTPAADEKAVAVAVSGGPDSMALCYLMSCRAAHYNPRLQIHAVTVDHGLRAGAAAEARKAGQWLADFPHVRHAILGGGRDGRSAPESRIMEYARDMRYGLLSDYCAQHRISKLYVAHHKDDQAETFLFRLAKGSGLDGLSAMRPVQPFGDDLALCRPFLTVEKERLVASCKAYDVPYAEDPSNRRDDFARVRLRQSADILAAEGLSAKRLSVTAARLDRARQALVFYADIAYEQAVRQESGHAVSFSFAALAAAPEEIRLRVLQKAVTVLRRRLDRAHVYGPRTERFEALADRIFSDPSFKSATLGGFIFARDKKRDELAVTPEGI